METFTGRFLHRPPCESSSNRGQYSFLRFSSMGASSGGRQVSGGETWQLLGAMGLAGSQHHPSPVLPSEVYTHSRPAQTHQSILSRARPSGMALKSRRVETLPPMGEPWSLTLFFPEPRPEPKSLGSPLRGSVGGGGPAL